MTEAHEQMRLIAWARWREDIPELALLFHVPNGGWRHKATAGRLKAMGAKPGVPDLFLPVPRQGHHGLWIELKWGKNRPTKKQRTWIEALRRLGYRVEVCYSCEEAEQVILDYLGREAQDGRRTEKR